MGKETNNDLKQSSLKDSKTKPTLRMRWRRFNSSWKMTIIPLLIWIVTAGYGYQKIDGTGGPQKDSYGCIYVILFAPFVFVSLIYSYVKNVEFLLRHTEREIESPTKKFFFFLYGGSLVGAFISIFLNNFMILFSSELTKTISGRLYIAFIILMPLSGFLFAKSNFELKIFHDRNFSFGAAITIIVGLFIGVVGHGIYQNHNNEVAQVAAIQTYLKDHHIKGDVKISSTNEYDENNISADYNITQEQTVIEASAKLKRKPNLHVVENSLTNYDEDAYKLSLGIMETPEADQIQTQARSAVKQAIKKNTFSHKLELQSEEQMAEGIRFLKGDEKPVLKKLAQANLASDSPNLRTFGGYPNIKFTDAFAAHAFVIYIGLKGKITEADLQKLLGSLDCSKLADGYYKLDGELVNEKSKESFEIRNHQIVKRLYLKYSNYVGGVEDQTRIDQLYF